MLIAKKYLFTLNSDYQGHHNLIIQIINHLAGID